LVHKLDLKKIIGQDEKGLFLISLNFGKKDVIYENMEAKENLANDYYYGEDYYTNPYKEGYYEQQGNHLLPIVVSDIGLTVKKGLNQVYAFATHLETAEPMRGVKIKLMTYQNQLIGEQSTDGQGKAVFDNVKQAVYFVEAQKGKQRSIVKLSEMAWNLSGFNTGGIDQLLDGIRAFIYTDRGVYRPGEKIYVSLIARNKQHTFPKDHPIEIKFYSPKSQLMSEKNFKKSQDGFYCFDLKISDENLTMNR